MLERYVRDIPEIVYELTGVSDNPLTIIYPNGKNLATGVCSEDGSVGIRICHDEFCHELISRFRCLSTRLFLLRSSKKCAH